MFKLTPQRSLQFECCGVWSGFIFADFFFSSVHPFFLVIPLRAVFHQHFFLQNSLQFTIVNGQKIVKLTCHLSSSVQKTITLLIKGGILILKKSREFCPPYPPNVPSHYLFFFVPPKRKFVNK